ncbi:hypothetical protein B0H16DRAFT_1792599 [Mycena metata]|uniref:Uncharacterized protein n=1 Tax=Mycena metata TaxID=1033252 RepID=A0AAD7HHW1_9AGAR|nr:hypothetical protein B0H16DRAFT_1792599 [Mycena metata]
MSLSHLADQQLAELEYLVDFFPSEERAASDGRGFSRRYVREDGRPQISVVVGEIREVIPMGSRRFLLVLTKPHNFPIFAGTFADAIAVLDDVLATDRADTNRLIIAQVAWCLRGVIFLNVHETSTTFRDGANNPTNMAMAQTGTTVVCRVAMAREEHLTPVGTTHTPLYSRTFKLHAFAVTEIFPGVERQGNQIEPSLTCTTMFDKTNPKFLNFIRLVTNAEYGEHITEYFTRIGNATLFAAAVESDNCRQKIMEFVRSRPESIALSDIGRFDMLPLELAYRLLREMDMGSRGKFGATCKEHRDISGSTRRFEVAVVTAKYHLDFKEVRFMLTATGTLMSGYALQQVIQGPGLKSDCLDFFTGADWTWDVMTFLALRGEYTVDPEFIPGELYTSYILRSRGRKIRVHECHKHPLACILAHENSHRMGFCDGDGIHYAYAELLRNNLTLATPKSMVIHDELEYHQEIWRLLEKARDHDLTWIWEHPHTHECGRDYSCPATLRHSRDRGWVHCTFTNNPFGPSPRLPVIPWSLCGTGCSTGDFGETPVLITLGDDEEWYATMNAFLTLDAPPATLETYAG